MNLLKAQREIASQDFDKRIFLEGIAGTGKSTAAIERMKTMIRQGIPADEILLLVPQAALAQPYLDALKRARIKANRQIATATIGSLSQRMVALFWPVIVESVGFANPTDAPHFLSLELVQYYMARFIGQEIEQRDYFNSVHISRNRLYTQILDNLNKSALVGFDYQSLAERLKAAWVGKTEQAYIYDDAQAAASHFREVCAALNLVDFSLQVNLFMDVLLPLPEVQAYLTQRYRHLIVDNIEEDTPATHDLLRAWLPNVESALVIYDTDAGYRRFLGADPVEAYKLKAACEIHHTLTNHRVMSVDMQAFQRAFAESLNRPGAARAKQTGEALAVLVYDDHQYHPQMLDWTAEQIARLVHEQGTPPDDIVILAPFVPDALRFSLQTRLAERGVASRTHRPSRALREEPTTRALMTLAKLAHPQWGLAPALYDVAFALTTAIDALDLVRARLLTGQLYRPSDAALHSFAQIENDKIQERITFELGERYERLYQWLTQYRAQAAQPLDIFLARLFGEVLSQPLFGLHNSSDGATTTANLIDSAREFRQTVEQIEPDLDSAHEYVRMVDAGVIANQYLRGWTLDKQNAVLISPAYAFLMNNQPVDYQFWLSVGSTGWAQRLYQPLTHPYVLSRQWPEGRVWTDMDEQTANADLLARLTLGLIRRCRKKIYLGFSAYNEQGYEPRGPLLITLQNLLRKLYQRYAADDV